MFAGRLGAVDERLIAEGRLHRAYSAADVAIVKKDPRAAVTAPRDPQLFVDEILRVARRRHGRTRLGRVL
jgi:hypothetical protein